MSFVSLVERIASLPLIICGPIVRRVSDRGVTVWLALKRAVESVALSVFEDVNGLDGELLAFGTASTVRLGEHLHVVTVTATPINDASPLEWGKSYVYDIAFDRQQPGGFNSLKDDGVLKFIEQITYPLYSLPAVMLPPTNISQLHLIQASCRNTKGVGLDAMPALHDILERDWATSTRPQQLFLTGDQIYADEVDDTLLYLLTDAAKVLLSGNNAWEESLPGIHQVPSDLGPGTRKQLLRNSARFTTKSGDSHLLSLGEYFAMYLFVWSDTLWPDIPEIFPESGLPDADEIYADFTIEANKPKAALQQKIATENDADKKQQLEDELKILEKNIEQDIEAKKLALQGPGGKGGKQAQLLLFLEGIGKIRKGLANIATYMTFDDHEVTDDWHLNRDWVEEVYQTPLGRRVLLNGLAAFAVFQAWGNTPERFAPSGANGTPKGQQLLEAISDWITHQCQAGHEAEAKIAGLVNVPFTEQEVDKLIDAARGGKLPVSPEAVRWDFTFQHPQYEAIFLDARTRRALPDKRYRPSEHLTDDAILEQIPLTTGEPEFTLLISPCNLVTIPFFRNWVGKYALPIKGMITAFTEPVGRHNMLANDPDLADSWVPQTKAFENVLSRLGSRVPIKSGKRRTRLVVLSGDVHFSAIMRLQYWADRPFRIYRDDPIKDSQANVPKDAPAEFIMAHLVSSGTKNEVDIFHYMHYLGYEVDDFLDRKENLPFPEIFLGYHKQADLGDAKSSEILLNTRWFPNYRPSLIRQEPVLIPFHQRDANLTYPPPDWCYRIDAIRGEQVEEPIEHPQDMAGFFKHILPHFFYSKDKVPGLEIISVNNIAEFDFHWAGEATLTKAVSTTDKTLEAEITKDFPPPPFQIVIDNEALEVLELEFTPPIGTFLKLRRGIDHTKTTEHAIGAKVTIRKSVNQIHWIMEPGEARPTGLFEQKSKRLTRFVIPLEFADPKYTEPDIPLVPDQQ